MEGKRSVTVVQTGSPIGRRPDQEATLKGLGLNKLRRWRVLEDTPAVRGMINKVKHLVRVVDEAPSGFDSRITRAEPRTLSVVIFRMKLGMSIEVGQALMQGASKQNRQRDASATASSRVKGGTTSAKFTSSAA